MRTIERTTQFKQDFKRASKGPHRAVLQTIFLSIVGALAEDSALPIDLRDHALTGEWKDFRDCHIRPDLVMIYLKPDETTLRLVMLGSHSELGI
jgi:mRNA interferase YafQ